MPEKNKTKYAILGVLSLKPRSGYDIKKFCDNSISYYWNENFGNIYPELEQMEAAGLVEPEEQGDKRAKTYRITDLGNREFVQWLQQPVEYRPARSELLLKLSFGNQIPKEKTLEMLEAARRKYAGDLKRYRVIEAAFLYDEEAKKSPEYPYWLAPLRHGIATAETMIKWCEETIESLK